VGGLVTITDGDLKLTVLQHFTQQFQIDVFTFAKHNICWDLIPKQQQLAERTCGWWENAHWATSFNKREKYPIAHQPGGTGIAVFNDLSHRALQPGSDQNGLGQWSWVRLRGQSSHILRIVLAYRPCYSSGPLSMYQQQVRYFAKLNCTDSPKQKFLTDLKKEILTWQAKGDTVILVADMNEDVRSLAIQDMLRAIGLVDGPTTLHASPPATYNHGMNPIDGIFLPSNLVDQCNSGYLEFGAAVPSNHRALWLDIPAKYVCPLEREAIE